MKQVRKIFKHYFFSKILKGIFIYFIKAVSFMLVESILICFCGDVMIFLHACKYLENMQQVDNTGDSFEENQFFHHIDHLHFFLAIKLQPSHRSYKKFS